MSASRAWLKVQFWRNWVFLMHYFDHSIIPIFHSIKVPTIRIVRSMEIFHILNSLTSSCLKKGMKSEISMSKIMNNRAIIKNWLENMVFFFVCKSNPHSNLLDFSFFFSFFSFKVFLRFIIIQEIDDLRIRMLIKFIR